MSHIHSTVSRRDFMKGIGLGAAGIGAAAAIAPVFHDMDEVLSSPSAVYKKPWWVKLVDEPTVPIDWSLLVPLRTKFALPPKGHNIGPDEAVARQVFVDYYQKLFPDWKVKGHTITGPHNMGWGDIRWDAMATSHLQGSGIPQPLVTQMQAKGVSPTSIVGMPTGWSEQPSWKDRGYPSRWEGTPEENLRTMTVIGRMAGADCIGAIPIDDHFLRLMWGKTGTSATAKTNVFGDVDAYVSTSTQNIIPNKCKWFLVWSQRHPYWQGNQYSAVEGSEGIVEEHAYNRITLHSIQQSMISLGYLSLQWSASIIPSGCGGVLAGIGEQCRQGTPMQPQYGLGSRVMWGFITDLPLAPTKPIDFGGYKFCHTCAICAELCMFQSIQHGDSTWTAPSSYEYNDRYNPGYKAWRNNTQKCNHCPVCMTVCPFSRNNPAEAGVHQLVRGTVSTTSAFNSFFASMQRSFGINGFKHPDDIWNADIIPWGVDTSQ